MKMTMVLAGQNSCCVYTNTNIMTAKFACNMFQTEPNGQTLIKTYISWYQNYMGVVSRLPIASPRHRLMETHYLTNVILLCRVPSHQTCTMVGITNCGYLFSIY